MGMNFSDLLKQLSSSAKDVAVDLAGNAEFITGALKSQFTPEGLKAITQGQIFLTEQALDREVRKRLGKESKVSLGTIRCLEDRIVASATATALTAKVAGDYQVRIEEMRLDREVQHLRMSMLSESYEGRNFLGSCACSVVGWYLKALVRKGVQKSELSQVLEFEGDNQVILKLGELDAIKRLKTEIVQGTHISALDLIQCSGAKHVMGGVQIQLGYGDRPALPRLGD